MPTGEYSRIARVALWLAGACVTPAFAQTAPDSAPASPSPDDIIVTGFRTSIQRALEQERQAQSVVSVLTADDIGQFADQNVAESLQRLPGVTIDRDEGEGRFVRVRGLSANFNQVTLNGAQVGSSDAGGGRSVALDVISSELLNSVRVAKALTPDFDHDSLGALVELRTLSAFDRKDGGIRLRAEGSYNERAAAWSPKIAGDITWRSRDDRFGAAVAFNYFDRRIQLDNLRNDTTPLFLNVFRTPAGTLQLNPATPAAGSTRFLIPGEADQRVEVGRRERIGATATLDFRPSDTDRYSLSFVGARLIDDDIRLQQEVEFRRVNNANQILAVDGRSATLNRVDFEKQIFFQDRTDRVFAANFAGHNEPGDWTLDYRVDWSHSLFTLPRGLRGRFRERDVTAVLNAGRTTIDLQLLPDADSDPRNPANFAYDGFLRIDERRTDEILTYGADLGRKLQLFGGDTLLKVGVKNRNRDKVIRRGELGPDPSSAANRAILAAAGIGTAAGANLSLLPLFTPARTRLDAIGVFPEIGAARDFFDRTATALNLTTVGQGRVDYDAQEDVLAGYALIDTEVSRTLRIVAGVRIENTDFEASGTRVERIELDGIDIGRPSTGGQAVRNSYLEVLPSVHIRWEPSRKFLARLVLSRNLVRPTFEDSRALQEITTERQTIGGVVRTVARELSGGNPLLKPLTANGLDATLGFYPDPNTALTAAAFYKDLENPFINATFRGSDVALTGQPLFDPATGEGFSLVDAPGNAGSGDLTGVEIGFSHFARWLPGALSGLFMTGNVTLIDGNIRSEFVRGGARLDLGNQPDLIGNVSVGYENKLFSLRWSANYVGESINDFDGSNPELDVINAAFFTMDVNLRVNLTKWLQVYADAVNINEARDIRFFRGGPTGAFYERVDDFGRTFQFGVIARRSF